MILAVPGNEIIHFLHPDSKIDNSLIFRKEQQKKKNPDILHILIPANCVKSGGDIQTDRLTTTGKIYCPVELSSRSSGYP